MKIQILDSGYIELVEFWGSDERIVEAARMSTNKGFLGWGKEAGYYCPECNRKEERNLEYVREHGTHHNVQGERVLNDSILWCDICVDSTLIYCEKTIGDEKLMGYLYNNKHMTPFEMAGLIVEVKAPIMVFREWHRHRTQCLAPDTLIHFDAPKSQDNRRFVYKMRIDEIYRKWQPTVRNSRPERQKNAFFPRSKIQNMRLRCLREGEIEHTNIVDVILGEPKEMIRVTTASGRTLTATREHKVYTNIGWLTLGKAVGCQALLCLEGVSRDKSMRWEVPILDTENEEWCPVFNWENYEVSTEGRVRRIGCEPKIITVGAAGYGVVSLSEHGKTYTYTVHTLVLEAFSGPRDGREVRHLNSNRADNRLVNLAWGTAQENANDRLNSDRTQRLVPVYEEIIDVQECGKLPTYDLTVADSSVQNFIANGFVVHNSYNEMSARYTPLPDENYMPTVDRCMVVGGKNKQTSGIVDGLTHEAALSWLEKLDDVYKKCQEVYSLGLDLGIPKELARLCVPVGRYSKMRASTNLRNWLAFLTLRMDKAAQYEIRVFAEALGGMIADRFPRTWELFNLGRSSK